jgi:hypothetical protein
MDFIKTISDWPVIVQGALGSALFWLVLELGQRVTRRLAAKVGHDRKTANWFSLAAHISPAGPGRDTARFFTLYGAIHYGLKGAIVTALSAALGGLLDVFASVGYLMAVYFFFRALSYVPHSSSHGTKEQQEKKFEQSRAEIRARNPQTVDSQLEKPQPSPGKQAEA